jgi:hypothetical protein
MSNIVKWLFFAITSLSLNLSYTDCIGKLLQLRGKVTINCKIISKNSFRFTERGTIIPLYIYPKTSNGSDAWKPLKEAFDLYPIEVWAIVNVNSGPGSKIDANFVTAISSLMSIGIKTLGYISTNYSKRPADTVRMEMRTWKSWYATNGIFLDEMTSMPSSSLYKYYSDLDDYAKSLRFEFTVGNPGTDIPLEYLQSVDTAMIYESSGFNNTKGICSSKYKSLQGKEALGIFPYNVPQLNERLILQAKKCVGYIYVTNDAGSNPWDTLPPYLKKLFEILSR